MSVFAFDNSVKQQIRKVIDYSNLNIYQVDDILDMMNREMAAPGEIPEHLVLVPIGRWICYYLVDHPEYGRCHYFQIKPDASGKHPDRSETEYILKEFGIKNPLIDKLITIDEITAETRIILPLDL